MRAEVFISHGAGDRERVGELAAALRAAGCEALFVDYDPETGIPPGADWERELYSALRRCDVLLALDGDALRTSRWCFAELALARSFGKTVIPVRIEDEEPREPVPVLLGDRQAVTLAGLSAASLEPLLQRLAGLGVGAMRTFRWDRSRSPYPGLSPLESQDAGVFFGRRDDTLDVVDKLEDFARFGDKSGVLLVGSSGSGKSSLLRAGVLAQLARRAGRRILGPLAPGSFAGAALADGDGLAVVAVDQIDELLAAGGGDELRELIERIAALPGRAILAGTLRTDAVDAFDAAVGDVGKRLEKVLVRRLTPADYRAIIAEPAHAAGHPLADELVDALLADVQPGRAGADALPLLAVTLRRLWDGDAMTPDGYRRSGGFEGAIERSAEAVMAASELDDDRVDALRRAFLRMAGVDHDGRIARRPLRLGEVAGETQAVLRRFLAKGLLVSGATEGVATLAHEALIRGWPRLRRWTEDARENLVRLERFEVARDRWRQDPRALLDALALAEADTLVAEGLLGEDAGPLLADSRAALDAAVAREREREHAIRVSESLRLASDAREAADREPATALLVAWEALLRDHNELSETVFRETLARMPAPVRVLRRAIRRGELSDAGFTADGAAVFFADRGGGAIELWDLGGTPIGWIPVPGPGQLAAAAAPGGIVSCRGGIVRLYSLDGAVLGELALEGGPAADASRARAFAFRVARGGRCLLRSGERFWLLELGGGVRVARELALGAGVFDVALDAGGRHILAETEGLELWSWDGVRLAAMEDPDGVSTSVAFVGDRIAAGTATGTGRLWTRDGTPLPAFRTGAGDLYINAVSPDGGVFATSAPVQVWSDAGELLSTLGEDGGEVRSAGFSADGARLACGAADGVVRVWDWGAQRRIAELHGHASAVDRVRFHPADPDVLLSRDRDGELRLWRLGAAPLPSLQGHAETVNELVSTPLGTLSGAGDASRLWDDAGTGVELQGRLISAPGAVFVTLDGGNTARLWSGATCRCTVAGPDRGTLSAAVAPDGERFVLTSLTDQVLWSADGDRLADLTVAEDRRERRVGRAGFHPDGRIVTASERGRVSLWSRDGEHLRTFLADFGRASDALLAIAADPQGARIAAGVRDRTILWTWDGEAAGELPVPGYKVQSVAWSPGGTRVATIAGSGSAYVAELWDRRGERVATLDAPRTAGPVAFDPRERYVVLVGAASDVRIFDLDGTRIGLLAAAPGTTLDTYAVAPGGELVAAAFSDGVARVWSLAERRRTMTLPVGDAWSLAFTADSRRLLLGRSSGAIEQHALAVADLYGAARERVDGGLTRDQLDRFGIAESALPLS